MRQRKEDTDLVLRRCRRLCRLDCPSARCEWLSKVGLAGLGSRRRSLVCRRGGKPAGVLVGGTRGCTPLPRASVGRCASRSDRALQHAMIEVMSAGKGPPDEALEKSR